MSKRKLYEMDSKQKKLRLYPPENYVEFQSFIQSSTQLTTLIDKFNKLSIESKKRKPDIQKASQRKKRIRAQYVTDDNNPFDLLYTSYPFPSTNDNIEKYSSKLNENVDLIYS